MPLLVPCPVTRRSSPAEDYMWTLNGVSTLIDQQQQLLKLFQNNTTTKENDNDEDDDDVRNTTHVSDNNDVRIGDSSQRNSNSLDKHRANSTIEVRQDLTRSSSSSMQTLRRILEIEELRKFSDTLESKIDRKFIK